VIGVVASVCREDHVDVQKEHASASVIDRYAFVERLDESSIRAKVDAGPRARSAVEDRDGRPVTRGASVAQLALQRRVDQLAERLTALACATLGGREQLVRNGHRGAHDAQNSASHASRQNALEGVAAIDKSTLLAEACRGAGERDMLVMSAAGVQSEADFR
jgi:hypothetical protein